jgi:hypothetical protein
MAAFIAQLVPFNTKMAHRESALHAAQQLLVAE